MLQTASEPSVGFVINEPVGAKTVRRCRVPAWAGFVPVVALPFGAMLLRDHVPAWSFMWLMLAAVLGGCKWLTWWRAITAASRVWSWRSAGYLFAWPGMDAPAFLESRRAVPRAGKVAWIEATLKVFIGVVLVWEVVRVVPPDLPYLAGWVGMVGLAFVMHFGVFHLLALGWQRAGVDALHVFRSPFLARSLSDFWGSRWNLAFRDLAYSFVFRPLAARLGTIGASFATFLASGLVHELVVSVPARAGYGLPTAYFLIQWLGVVVERSAVGKQLGLRHGAAGWLFAFVVTAGPACLLFHPPFVARVVVPFFSAVGAL